MAGGTDPWPGSLEGGFVSDESVLLTEAHDAGTGEVTAETVASAQMWYIDDWYIVTDGQGASSSVSYKLNLLDDGGTKIAEFDETGNLSTDSVVTYNAAIDAEVPGGTQIQVDQTLDGDGGGGSTEIVVVMRRIV